MNVVHSESVRSNRLRAMGTEVMVVAQGDCVEAAERIVVGVFSAWDATLSHSRPDSELNRLNDRPGRPVGLSRLLFLVLERALAASRATGGRYDPMLEGLPGAWRAIALDPASRSVVLPPGARLDLGGIATGMAVDAAVAALRRAGLAGALVSAGDALGTCGRPPGRPGWPVAVEGQAEAPACLTGGALATSSGPVSAGLRSATVAAPRCAGAKVAAEVAMVLGPFDGAAFLRDRDLAGLLVPLHGPAVPVGDWPGALEEGGPPSRP